MAVSKAERVVDLVGIKVSIAAMLVGAFNEFLETQQYLFAGIIAILLGFDLIAIYLQMRPSRLLASTGASGPWHVFGILAGIVFLGAGVYVLLIDFPVGLTDPVSYVLLAVGAVITGVCGWSLQKPDT